MMLIMDIVGRYRVERRLGAGAFSTVWLAHDDALDIPVALKMLSENWTEHADVRSRFLDEARLLRRISDPHVIGVHDIGTMPDGRDYFVMDYADGGTLAEICQDPIPAPEALRLGVGLARGVAVLHRNGVLHRDLKPANVLLMTDGEQPRPVIADLGMAKRLAEASGLTVAAGTPAYMAPEQARGRDLDERTDVYGLAAVCYRMLSGVAPGSGETVTTVANRPAAWRPAPIPPSIPMPYGLEDALREAMSTDPDRRPASAAALADRLESLAGSPAGQRQGGAAAARSGRSRPTAAGGLRVALLGIVSAAITWLLLSLLIAR